MIYTKKFLPFLKSIQYMHLENIEHDYFTQPRPCHNFAFMLEGEATIQSNTEIIQVKPGDILFIPQNTTYKVKWLANPKAVFHSLHFSFFLQNDVFLGQSVPIQILSNTYFNDLYFLLKEIEKYQSSNNADSFLALSAFFKICGTLFKQIKISETPSIEKNLQPAIAYIHQNYTKHFTVEHLAELCFLSPSRFYYLFKKQTGASPIAYKNNIIIQNASRELLCYKEKTIGEIAQKYGFASLIYFEQLFKKTVGKTPSQYRQEDHLI